MEDGTGSYIALWGFFLVSLLLSAFFSAVETAFASLTDAQRQLLRKQQPDAAEWVDELLNEPQLFFNSLLFGNILVNTIAAVLGFCIAVLNAAPMPMLVATVAMFALLYFWGELIPKSIALQQAPAIAAATVPLVKLWLALIRAPIGGAEKIARWICDLATPAHWTASAPAARPTEDEYLDLLEEAEKAGLVVSEERTMISRILGLSRKTLADIMTPLPDMQTVDDTLPREQIADALKRIKHARVPVTHGSPDEIVGIINARDFLLFPASELDAVIELPSFVPETMSAARLLQTFQRGGHKTAIIVDEYGNTVGMVTMEDIIEEIVGEIDDEFDVKELLIQKLSDTAWLVHGKTHLDLLNETIGTTLAAAGVDTLGGWFVAQVGALPKEGDKITRDEWTFTAKRVGKNVIREILIERTPPPPSAEPPPPPPRKKRRGAAKPQQTQLPLDPPSES
jgi:putative hemolysin